MGSFYKYANSKLSNHRGIGILLDNAGNTHSNYVDKTILLNNYFSSVCTLDDGLTPDVVPRVSQSDGIDNISFFPVFVARALRKVKPSHSCAPDGLPSMLYNKLSKSLAHPLSLIFESFMTIGKVSDEWRSATVTPVHKGGLASIISNYRLVSLTRVASKSQVAKTGRSLVISSLYFRSISSMFMSV